MSLALVAHALPEWVNTLCAALSGPALLYLFFGILIYMFATSVKDPRDQKFGKAFAKGIFIFVILSWAASIVLSLVFTFI